jgi:hypothetical protein
LNRSECAKRRHAPGFTRRRQKSWRVALALGSRARLSISVRFLPGLPGVSHSRNFSDATS